MKNIINGIVILFIMGAIFWLIASFININMCNDFGSNYQNFSDWNFFTMLQTIIKK